MKTNEYNKRKTANAMSLTDAVLEASKDLIVTRGKFTAHDVTDVVRDSVNIGDISLPGLEAKDNDKGIVYWVKHESVSVIVNMFSVDGTYKKLGMVAVEDNCGERVYRFSDNTVSTNATTEVPVNSEAPVNHSPVARKVSAYFLSRSTATVRQIHSLLKINGLTCKELVEMLKEWGYTVSEGTPNCFSTYTVTV
jgi:hypothetical protein